MPAVRTLAAALAHTAGALAQPATHLILQRRRKLRSHFDRENSVATPTLQDVEIGGDEERDPSGVRIGAVEQCGCCCRRISGAASLAGMSERYCAGERVACFAE